jgi:hypothetical protein
MVQYLKTCSDKSERIETAADSEGGEHGERVEPLLVQHRPFDGRDRNNADTKNNHLVAVCGTGTTLALFYKNASLCI